jgi:hypothetical protein
MKIDHLREMKTVVVLKHTPYHLVTGVPIENEAGGFEEKTCSVLVRQEDLETARANEAESKRSMAFSSTLDAAQLGDSINRRIRAEEGSGVSRPPLGRAISNAIGVKSSQASATVAMSL